MLARLAREMYWRRSWRLAFRRIALGRGASAKLGLRKQGKGSRSRREGRWAWQKADWASGGLCVRGMVVGGLGFGGLDVGVGWFSSRHHSLSREMEFYVAKSVGRPLRFRVSLSVRPKVISGHLIGRECATQPVSSCRGARIMGIRATWPAQRGIRLW